MVLNLLIGNPVTQHPTPPHPTPPHPTPPHPTPPHPTPPHPTPPHPTPPHPNPIRRIRACTLALANFFLPSCWVDASAWRRAGRTLWRKSHMRCPKLLKLVRSSSYFRRGPTKTSCFCELQKVRRNRSWHSYALGDQLSRWLASSGPTV